MGVGDAGQRYNVVGVGGSRMMVGNVGKWYNMVGVGGGRRCRIMMGCGGGSVVTDDVRKIKIWGLGRTSQSQG